MVLQDSGIVLLAGAFWTETFDAMVLPCHIRYERKLNREITNLEIVYIFEMYVYIFGPILGLCFGSAARVFRGLLLI